MSIHKVVCMADRAIKRGQRVPLNKSMILRRGDVGQNNYLTFPARRRLQKQRGDQFDRLVVDDPKPGHDTAIQQAMIGKNNRKVKNWKIEQVLLRLYGRAKVDNPIMHSSPEIMPTKK